MSGAHFEDAFAAIGRALADFASRAADEAAWAASSLRGIRAVSPTVVSFRPLPTAARHPPWEPESLIVDDLGVPRHRRERRV